MARRLTAHLLSQICYDEGWAPWKALRDAGGGALNRRHHARIAPAGVVGAHSLETKSLRGQARPFREHAAMGESNRATDGWCDRVGKPQTTADGKQPKSYGSAAHADP
jgi:hypothetical protein